VSQLYALKVLKKPVVVASAAVEEAKVGLARFPDAWLRRCVSVNMHFHFAFRGRLISDRMT
jgi:hypothetical protein